MEDASAGGTRREADVEGPVAALRAIQGEAVTAPSERCARCGHSATSHNPFSKGPCYVRNVVGDRRSTYGKHHLSHKEVVCPCPAYVPPAPSASGDQ